MVKMVPSTENLELGHISLQVDTDTAIASDGILQHPHYSPQGTEIVKTDIQMRTFSQTMSTA